MDFTGNIWTHLACIVLSGMVVAPITYFVTRFIGFRLGYFKALAHIENYAKEEPDELMQILFGYTLRPLSEEESKALSEAIDGNNSNG